MTIAAIPRIHPDHVRNRLKFRGKSSVTMSDTVRQTAKGTPWARAAVPSAALHIHRDGTREAREALLLCSPQMTVDTDKTAPVCASKPMSAAAAHAASAAPSWQSTGCPDSCQRPSNVPETTRVPTITSEMAAPDASAPAKPRKLPAPCVRDSARHVQRPQPLPGRFPCESANTTERPAGR